MVKSVNEHFHFKKEITNGKWDIIWESENWQEIKLQYTKEDIDFDVDKIHAEMENVNGWINIFGYFTHIVMS